MLSDILSICLFLSILFCVLFYLNFLILYPQNFNQNQKYQMSEDHHDKPVKIKQNQNEVRQFGCPCGKTYLSYPALYTHVRTKHDGKPPGELMKPKNQKTRGRPRTIIVDTPIDDSKCPFNIKQQVERAINNSKTVYAQNFQISLGNQTCQDMASKFIAELDSLQEEELKIIRCFLNEFRQFINSKYGQNFWEESSPKQIIDSVNEFYSSHDNKKQKYPLENKILIDLTILLFKWMYRNNWTEHKIAKKP